MVLFHHRTLSVLLALALVDISYAQQLGNYDFSTRYPDYSYGLSYAGQGASDCTNVVNDADTQFTHQAGNLGPYLSTTADFTQWTIEPQACYTYAGFGGGVGAVLAADDGAGLEYFRRFTSNDFSRYSITAEAWVEGVSPNNPAGLPARVFVDFLGPDISTNSGNPRSMLRLSNEDSSPIFLTGTPQTISFTLDELVFETGNDFYGEPYEYQSYDEYAGGDWSAVTHFAVQVSVQGDQFEVGLDANNSLFMDNIVIDAPFVELSGDFDSDGLFTCLDINSLTEAIALQVNIPEFDLTENGILDLRDRDQWLAKAGAASGSPTGGTPFIVGDANLDGSVDASDFNVWNSHKFSNGTAWCSGDFNADATTDASDFNIWNENKFSSATASVPEPNVLPLFLVTFLMIARKRRTLRS